MALFWKIVVFICFLLFDGLWIWGMSKLQNRLYSPAKAKAANKLPTKAVTAYILTSILALSFPLFAFVSIWILTGYVTFRLITVFIVVTQLSIILQIVAASLLVSSNLPHEARRFCFGFETGLKHGLATFMVFITSALCFAVIIPVMCGLAFFATGSGSEDTAKQLFKILFGSASVVGLLTLISFQIPFYLSRNVDHENRLQAFSTQIAFVFSAALLFSVFTWSLQLSTNIYMKDIGPKIFATIPMLSVSPIMLGMLALYIVFSSVGPFALGSRRAAIWERDLANRKQLWLGELADTLKYPTPTTYTNKLEHLAAKIAEERTGFISKDKFINWIYDDSAMAPIDTAQRERVLSQVEEYRHLDPRLAYVDFLETTSKNVEEVKVELAKTAEEKESIDRAGKFYAAFRDEANDLSKAEHSQVKSAALVFVVVSFIASALMTGIINKIGEAVATKTMSTFGAAPPNE
jgi:hypothetical protein